MNSIIAASKLYPCFQYKIPFLLQHAPKPHHYFTAKNTCPTLLKINPSTIFQSLKQQNPDPLCIFHNPRSCLAAKCSLNQQASGEDLNFPHDGDQPLEGKKSEGFFSKWKANSAEMSSKLAKLGLAAVLAYGLFDGVTYTSFFILAFLGYEKSTGKNPAANLRALLGIVILMWAGNNVTRPFRIAGAAALAPFIDKGLKKIQNYFNFPNMVYAFILIVLLVASVCFTIVGLLILSRWGK